MGEVADTILHLARAVGPDKSICPSEVARALRPVDWRPLMPAVREAAASLARQGNLVILQRGCEIDPDALRGAIRLRIVLNR